MSTAKRLVIIWGKYYKRDGDCWAELPPPRAEYPPNVGPGKGYERAPSIVVKHRLPENWKD